MNKIEKCYYRLFYRFSYKMRVRIARKLGVRFAANEGEERCNILTNPFAVFGSEPYLIRLGKHVEITKEVKFITHDGGLWVLHDDPDFSDYDFFGPITVGDNVFFGNGAIILPGVTIGDNCVIGAGAIVTKDIPSNSVVAGIPAKVLGDINGYKEKVKRNGTMKTNKLSAKEKEIAIKREHPEWFEV